jgi:hypothetical protein
VMNKEGGIFFKVRLIALTRSSGFLGARQQARELPCWSRASVPAALTWLGSSRQQARWWADLGKQQKWEQQE